MLARLIGLIRRRGRWRGEATYFLAFNVTNALNYAYLVGMGLLLGTESYGLFGALFGLIYLVSALGNTVQVATARHVACLQTTGGALLREAVAGVLLWAGGLATAVGLAFLALSPVLGQAFHSPPEPLLWTGLAIALSVFVPAGYGVLQGVQRFRLLALSLLAAALVRLASGSALVAVGLGPSGALAGVAIGYIASGLLALLAVPTERRAQPQARISAPSLRSLAAILAASLALAAPTSLDVALVKHFFPAAEAGLFMAVAVLGRVVLFVPLAVSFIALPKVAVRIARGDDPAPLLWASLALTGALAGGAALALAAMSGLGWSPVGADISGAMAALRWYLPAMVALALVAALVYYQIGCGNGSYVFAFLLPGIAVQAVLIILFHDSLAAVARAVFAVSALLLAAGLLSAVLPRLRASYGRRALSWQAGSDA